jgi:hypothetical protein
MALVLAGAERGAPETSTMEVAKGMVPSGTAVIWASVTIRAMPPLALNAQIRVRIAANLTMSFLLRKSVPDATDSRNCA